MELTAAGRAFLGEARIVLAYAARARTAAARAASGEIGELAIGFVPTCDGQLLRRTIAHLRAAAPALRIRIESLNTAAQAAALATGTLDAGFVRLPLPDPLLETAIVQRERIWVSIPQSHPLAAQATLTLPQVAAEDLVLFPRPIAPGYHDALLDMFTRAGLRPTVAQHVEQVQAILTVVAAGLGLSLHPAATTALAFPGVVYRPLDASLTVDTALAWRRDRRTDGLSLLLAAVDLPS